MLIDKMFLKNFWAYKTVAFARFLKCLGVLFSLEKLLYALAKSIKYLESIDGSSLSPW